MTGSIIQEPIILITGTEINITNVGARDTNTAITDTINSAGSVKGEDSWLHMAGYVFTKDFAAMDDLKECIGRGTKTRIVINRLLKKHVKDGQKDNNTGRDVLLQLNRDYTNVELYSFKSNSGDGDLHAKTIIANRSRAVVGSANFSVGGLDKNYELGLYVTGDTAFKLASFVDSIASNSNLCTLITEKNEFD
jgi:cardiolipin synthase